MKRSNMSQIAGWTGVILSTAITGLWAFWGIFENFHEGWYYESLILNLGLMFFQYLSPMFIFAGLTAISVIWPRIGGGLHVILAVLAAGFFRLFSSTVTLLLILPLIGIGALYWFGRIPQRKLALFLVVGLPLMILVMFGVAPAIRVSQRIDDGNYQARLVHGNGVSLVWAPAGPGWPMEGTDWQAAQKACQYLHKDGFTQAPEPQDIWRLPTAAEIVRSMARHGQNCGGIWDSELGQAFYKFTPDKESPLWYVHSQVIYWWTASEIDADRAYIIVYDGRAWPRRKQFDAAYLGYRCVKEP